MGFIKHTSKLYAAKSVINTWLRDQTVYCNNCNLDANYLLALESCCENPQLGRNIDHMKGCVRQNKVTRDMAANDLGSTKDKSIRLALSMPPRLVMILEKYFDDHDEKLFNNSKELHAFMKAFPALCSCREV